MTEKSALLDLSLKDILYLLQNNNRELCLQAIDELIGYHQSHWVYQEYQKATPTPCFSKLKSFVRIAQLSDEGQEPFRDSYIDANRHNANASLNNNILPITQEFAHKHHQGYIAPTILLFLFLAAPMSVFATHNDFIDGIPEGQKATNIPEHLQKEAHLLYKTPLIERMYCFLISSRAEEFVEFTKRSLEFYLQYNPI